MEMGKNGVTFWDGTGWEHNSHFGLHLSRKQKLTLFTVIEQGYHPNLIISSSLVHVPVFRRIL